MKKNVDKKIQTPPKFQKSSIAHAFEPEMGSF